MDGIVRTRVSSETLAYLRVDALEATNRSSDTARGVGCRATRSTSGESHRGVRALRASTLGGANRARGDASSSVAVA